MGERSLVDFLIVLLRRRHWVVIPAVLAGFLTIVVVLFLPRTFTSHASFMPQDTERTMSSLSGLAAQLGVTVPTGGGGQSPQFYAELVTTPTILRAVVTERYRMSGEAADDGVTLLDLFGVGGGGETPAMLEDEAIRELQERVSVRTSRLTDVVYLSVTVRDPGVAQGIARKIIEQVNRFNLERRQSQAVAERSFVEERRRAARTELRAAEDRLEAFLRKNRQFASSPQLLFTHDRLQREVATQQQVYTSLAQGYEQARIEEVRNTPVITVVQDPILPTRADRKRMVLKGMVAAVLGGLLGLFLLLGGEAVDGGRPQPVASDRETLRQLGKQTVTDLRRPWRLLQGVD